MPDPWLLNHMIVKGLYLYSSRAVVLNRLLTVAGLRELIASQQTFAKLTLLETLILLSAALSLLPLVLRRLNDQYWDSAACCYSTCIGIRRAFESNLTKLPDSRQAVQSNDFSNSELVGLS